MKKSFRQLERWVRGFSNHRRIEILTLLEKNPELSVLEISQKLNIKFTTASAHLTRLATAGLVLKKNDDQAVRHKISHRAKQVLMFLRTLE